jgi:hypothetical protein
MLESAARHVRVTHDVVLHAEQRFFRVIGHAHEDAVCIGDAAFQVGFGDDEFIGAEMLFALRGNDIRFHGDSCPARRLKIVPIIPDCPVERARIGRFRRSGLASARQLLGSYSGRTFGKRGSGKELPVKLRATGDDCV